MGATKNTEARASPLDDAEFRALIVKALAPLVRAADAKDAGKGLEYFVDAVCCITPEDAQLARGVSRALERLR